MRFTNELFVAAVLALVACGGSTLTADDTAGDAGSGDATQGHDSASQPDGSTGADAIVTDQDGQAVPGACPSSPPVAGTACVPRGPAFECEYGASWYGDCDVIVHCDPTTSQWRTDDDGGNCGFTNGGGACPATFASVPQGQACGPQGASCDYAEGHCDCIGWCGGPPPPPDAGNLVTWKCNQQTAPCPNVRPRLGTVCASDGQSCTYDVCCAGTSITCKGGYWEGQIMQGGCP